MRQSNAERVASKPAWLAKFVILLGAVIALATTDPTVNWQEQRSEQLNVDLSERASAVFEVSFEITGEKLTTIINSDFEAVAIADRAASDMELSVIELDASATFPLIDAGVNDAGLAPGILGQKTERPMLPNVDRVALRCQACDSQMVAMGSASCQRRYLVHVRRASASPMHVELTLAASLSSIAETEPPGRFSFHVEERE